MSRPPDPRKRARLLRAGERLMLSNGVTATSVQGMCGAARISKGAFFHYFAGKDAASRAILEEFVTRLVAAYGSAAFHSEPDAVKRCLAYVDFTAKICRSSVLRDGCLVAAFSLEVSGSDARVRGLCAGTFTHWSEAFARDLSAAREQTRPPHPVDTGALARHFIAIVEGSLILAKTLQRPAVIDESLGQFRQYLSLLFPTTNPQRSRHDRVASPRQQRNRGSRHA